MMSDTTPKMTFHMRVPKQGGGEAENACELFPMEWKDVSSDDIFKGKRVIVFALPGAYTPTCSTFQLPGFEEMYEEFTSKGIDEIYCLSVNDSFVMNNWADSQGIKKVKMLPDGNAEFTKGMAMNLDMSAVGFGTRSRRYAMVVTDGIVENMFAEPNGSVDNPDPYGESSPENVMQYVNGVYQSKASGE